MNTPFSVKTIKGDILHLLKGDLIVKIDGLPVNLYIDELFPIVHYGKGQGIKPWGGRQVKLELRQLIRTGQNANDFHPYVKQPFNVQNSLPTEKKYDDNPHFLKGKMRYIKSGELDPGHSGDNGEYDGYVLFQNATRVGGVSKQFRAYFYDRKKSTASL